MAYVALYRAYRPQKFADVVGQQHIIKTLQNAIKLNKVAHAYLFCGPRGTGKTTLAKIMAKALNCEHGPAVEPCDECEVCLGIQKGTVADVIEIDAASNNGADDIRALRDSVKYLPSVGRYKVYIIDEVHMLSNAAFNALLKTLEEPPKHVTFILATTEPYKLPNTILSRCQRFDFQAISLEDILERLRIVADSENVVIKEDALQQIAASAEGGMRDALSLFDQCISYSVSESISLDDVLAVSGNVSYVSLVQLLMFCVDGNGVEALKIVDQILKSGKEVPRVINDLILFLRDVLLYKNMAILEQKIMFQDKIFIDFSKKISKGTIYSWLDILNDSNNNMRFSNQKRAYLELAVLKMNDTHLNEEASILDRVEQLENTISTLANPGYTPIISKQKEIPIVVPTVEEVEQSIQARTPTSPPPSAVEYLENEIQMKDIENILNAGSKDKKQQLLELWKRIEEDYSSVFIIQMLIKGEVVAVSEEAFIVVLQDQGFCNRLMCYENYVKIMEVFAGYNISFKEYICLPKAVWLKIKADYSTKFKSGILKPTLEPISIGVMKRKVPMMGESQKDDIEQKLYEYIEKEKVEIMEE